MPTLGLKLFCPVKFWLALRSAALGDNCRALRLVNPPPLPEMLRVGNVDAVRHIAGQTRRPRHEGKGRGQDLLARSDGRISADGYFNKTIRGVESATREAPLMYRKARSTLNYPCTTGLWRRTRGSGAIKDLRPEWVAGAGGVIDRKIDLVIGGRQRRTVRVGEPALVVNPAAGPYWAKRLKRSGTTRQAA